MKTSSSILRCIYQCNSSLLKKIHSVFLFIYLGISVQVFSQVPVITSISVNSATIGSSIVINGTNFSRSLTNNFVYFGNIRGIVTSASANSLTVIVPKTTALCELKVITAGKVSNTKYFKLKNPTSGNLNLRWSTSYFKEPTFLYLNSRANIYTWEPADIDNDGDLDFITATNTNKINIISNSGAIENFVMDYLSQNTVTLANVDTKVNDIKCADINNDGYIDIAVALAGRKVEILKNNGDGTFSSATTFMFNSLNSNLNSISILDVNRDGMPDIMGSTYFVSNYYSAFQIFTQSAATSFSFSSYYSSEVGVDDSHSMRNGLADINNDTYVDAFILVGSSSVPGTNGMNVAFATATSFNTLSNMPGSEEMYGRTDISFIDFDDDGDIDVFAPGQTGSRFYTNNGNGSFSFSSTTNHINFGQLFDIDNDGDLDIIGSDFTNMSASQNIAGVYQANTIFAPNNGLGESQLLDLNGDGYMDVVFLNFSGSVLYASIFRGSPMVSTSGLTSVPGVSAWSIPGSNKLVINIPLSMQGNSELYIYDALGRTLQRELVLPGRKEVNLGSSMSSGLYFIKLLNGNDVLYRGQFIN